MYKRSALQKVPHNRCSTVIGWARLFVSAMIPGDTYKINTPGHIVSKPWNYILHKGAIQWREFISQLNLEIFSVINLRWQRLSSESKMYRLLIILAFSSQNNLKISIPDSWDLYRSLASKERAADIIPCKPYNIFENCWQNLFLFQEPGCTVCQYDTQQGIQCGMSRYMTHNCYNLKDSCVVPLARMSDLYCHSPPVSPIADQSEASLKVTWSVSTNQRPKEAENSSL